MGTQKITMGRRGDTEYESKKRAAMAQADYQNGYMWGMQTVYDQGSGSAIKAQRDPNRGNTNLMPGDLADGSQGIFKPRTDAVGNQVIGDPVNTSGYLEGQTSMTVQPQTDPEVAGKMAMERLQMMAAGLQYPGLNDRSQIMSI